MHKYAHEHLILTWFECTRYEEDFIPNQGANVNEIDFANGRNDESTLDGGLGSTNDEKASNHWLLEANDSPK